ncbi:MAG: trimethylamine methyltransferase family protein [Candidatus Lokiarchaeota archaeon]|nr:trimethylamine methyltransferase family protein [Candidatus Lokiarchaeota archaeon]
MPIIKPKIQILDNEHKKLIFNEAKIILETQGVFIENQEAIDLFSQQGLNYKEQRFYIPSDLVDKCLKSVPNEITLFDREGKEHISLKNDQVHFDPGSAAIFILDENTGEIREANSNDFIKFSKIVEQLKYIEAQSTALIYQDVPKDAQDWHRLFISLSNCHKPVVTGTFRKDSFSIMREILLSCRLSEDDLARKPLAIFDACPSPPLKWSDLTSQSVIDAAKSMIPSEFVSMPLAGASAPITLLGSITQHCAETLVGVVIAQLAKRGAPLIWGGSPAVMDMKHGTTPMGAIETMMINIGDIEMGKFLKMPTHAYMSLSDAKIPDAQAGFEAGMGALLAGLAGINMISGPGMLDFESTQSIEKLLIDNEIIGMVKRFLQGIEDYGSPFALDILKDFREQEELLSHPSTLKLFRKELFFPSSIIDRKTRDSWRKLGSKSARKRAREEADRLLNMPPIQPINEILAKELNKIVTKYLQ